MTSVDELTARIRDRDFLVGVIGLGYVGLPLALTLAEHRFKVLGFDVDAAKVEQLGRHESYIRQIAGTRIAAAVSSGSFEATSDFDRLGAPDALIICVPTPLTPQREPDTSYVAGTARQIARSLRRGQLVVLESTTYPGTTDELVRGILDETGKLLGEDYFLAFSPEREDPGNPLYGTSKLPKVVGGVGTPSGDLAEALYAEIVPSTVRVSSARAAEATKLMENIFRAVNIALVNELKVIYEKMGIDIWEVLDAASTKPFGFMRFNPGPGWGGHCIPLDPFYLSWKAREFGEAARFIELAGEVNLTMPDRVVGKLANLLNDRGKAVRGSRILLLGLAYKKDVDDIRESPALAILGRLHGLGAILSYHDPFVPVLPQTRHAPGFTGMRCVELSAQSLSEIDVALVVTDHTGVDYRLVVEHAPLVVDTRGVYHQRYPELSERVPRA